jgi:hypothetical protein
LEKKKLGCISRVGGCVEVLEWDEDKFTSERLRSNQPVQLKEKVVNAN